MNLYITILIMAIGTYLTRKAPFWFLGNRELSANSQRIINLLPYATASLLVVYSLKDTTGNNLLPTVVGVSVCVATYMWKNNTILSVVASTAIYMVLLSI